MKKSELIMLLLYVPFVAGISQTETLSFYTPKLVIGGLLILSFILASCVLREKSANLNDEEKSLQYNRLALAFQVISWLLFAFYLAMVVIGF